MTRSPTRLLCFGLTVAWLVACAPSAAPAAKPASGSAPAAPPAAASASAPAAAPAATAPGPAAAAAPPARVAVKVGAQGRPDQAHLILAQERGYFAEQGLDTEFVLIATGAEMVPALATNQVQVGNGAPSAALFNALNRGIDIRLVADYAHLAPASPTTLSFVVRKELHDSGAVRTMANMVGRVLALTAPPGQITDMMYARALAREGISGEGIETKYLTFADTISALGGGHIDAGLLTEPQVSQLALQGVAEVLYPGAVLIPGGVLSALQYSPQFATDQPDAATRFMIGYLKGVRDYYDAFHLKQNRDAAIAILVEQLPIKDPRVWESYPPSSADLNGKLNVDNLREAAAFYLQQGTLQGGIPDLDRFLAPQFAEAAVRQLGPR